MSRRLIITAAGALVVAGLTIPALASQQQRHDICVDNNGGTQGFCVTWEDPNTGVGIPPIG